LNKKEKKLKWHKFRMRYIVVLGLAVMLFLSVEYIRGGTHQVQHTVDIVAEEAVKMWEMARWRVRIFLEEVRRAVYKEEQIILPAEGHMKVHFLDVGQADCTLIQTENAAMLVDGGNDEDGKMIVEYLRQHGVERLEYVIGTHPHEDHIGGLDSVLMAFDVEMVILPDVEADTPVYEELIWAVEDSEADVIPAEPGQKYLLGNAMFQVIAPVSDYEDDLNSWSVGVRLVFGENAFVFTGDAEIEAEEDMVKSLLPLKADVWKAGHHGSETSNGEWILAAVNPDYAVISCGKDNTYGHPHQSVLRKLQWRGIEVFRTDEQGTIIADCDGKNITWN